MIEETLERKKENQSPPKGVNKGRIVCPVVWNDRAMRDDKRKAWHATSTPSQKHGLIEQGRMIEEILERNVCTYIIYIYIYKKQSSPKGVNKGRVFVLSVWETEQCRMIKEHFDIQHPPPPKSMD